MSTCAYDPDLSTWLIAHVLIGRGAYMRGNRVMIKIPSKFFITDSDIIVLQILIIRDARIEVASFLCQH